MTACCKSAHGKYAIGRCDVRDLPRSYKANDGAYVRVREALLRRPSGNFYMENGQGTIFQLKKSGSVNTGGGHRSVTAIQGLLRCHHSGAVKSQTDQAHGHSVAEEPC